MDTTCKICFEEVAAPSLEAHLANQHGDSPASVREVYPEQYDELFVGDELAPGWADDAPADGNGESDGDRDDGGREDGEAGAGAARQASDSGSRTDRAVASGGSGSASARTREETGATGADGSRAGNAGEPRGTGTGSPAVGQDAPGAEGLQSGKKWLMIGVGGAGNHIIDAVLMRRDTLRERDEPLAGVWEGGLADYGSLNTNIAELGDTYYAREDRGYDRQQLLQNAMIAARKHNHQGAGRKWTVGRKLMQADFDGESNALRDRWDISANSLEASQAVMLVHSVTKGTGCGATPVLAENISEMAGQGVGLDDELAVTKPILSSVIIPEDDDFGGSEMVRGVAGMAHLSKAVDGIIPFDNQRLDEVGADISVAIDEERLNAYNPINYVDINRLLVAFLEAFTMSSTPQNYDQSATRQINGEVFDVPDSFRPAEPKYPADSDRDHQPAVIMAPVIGRSFASSFDRSTLSTLARTALFKGQLIDFDPSTAWGGSFMIYGPEEKMEEIAPLVNANELKDILSGEEFLDRGSTDPGQSVDLYVNQLVVPGIDSVHLWGVLWNPQIPSLGKMYDHVKELSEQSDSQQADNVRELWPLVESLFGAMGRDAMG
ncbi:cell division protein FtsZ [Halosimplex rubrum]|uniref:Cell division protein FtsZ n=1 Tax=Halosimplex rubrum TaxID=869889 RepID=A0A7D5NZ08_9EURY|nr:cell division protein FtsZ [Halosimplex rubrum]QLH76557.1 cell division protein FtsZ [Halosimplex rubrum]